MKKGEKIKKKLRENMKKKNKTRQDKSRQGKTKQGKARQYHISTDLIRSN